LSEVKQEKTEGHQKPKTFVFFSLSPVGLHEIESSAEASLLLVGVSQTPPIPKQENASSLMDEAEGFEKSLLPHLISVLQLAESYQG
jgi:hypothetical protein